MIFLNFCERTRSLRQTNFQAPEFGFKKFANLANLVVQRPKARLGLIEFVTARLPRAQVTRVFLVSGKFAAREKKEAIQN